MIEQQREIIALEQRTKALAAADPPGTWLGFVPTTVLQPFAADGFVFMAGLPRASQTPRRFRCWAFVVTQNNGANYWTIEAQDAATNSIATVSTGGGVPISIDTWSVIETTTMLIDPLTVGGGESIVQIYITKVGSPGDLSLIPMFYVV